MGGPGKGRGESNEEATLRLIAEGAGKKGGKQSRSKGQGKSTSYHNTDVLPSERRDELRKELEAFVAGPEMQLNMPPSVTGMERKYLHELSEELGLQSQSFGAGQDRFLAIMKVSTARPAAAEVVGEEPAAAAVKGEIDPAKVTYSSMVLSPDSQERLRAFCQSAGDLFGPHPGIPDGWTVYCEHMTICVGSLKNPKTPDNRSVADDIRKQSQLLKDGQPVEIKVVSVGACEGVHAVGVMGCVSCNKTPHITVATAKGTRPFASNQIRKWTALPEEKQLALEGLVWQRAPGRPSLPPAWLWPQKRRKEVDFRDYVLTVASQLSKLLLAGQADGRPSTLTDLHTMLQQECGPRAVYMLHPVKLAEALGAVLPSQEDVIARLAERLRPPADDPLELFSALPPCVNGEVVTRVRRDLAERLAAEGEGGSFDAATWLVSQAYEVPDLTAELLVNRLQADGALEIDEGGSVRYLALGDDSQTAAALVAKTAYLQPWPMGAPVRLKEEQNGDDWHPGSAGGSKGKGKNRNGGYKGKGGKSKAGSKGSRGKDKGKSDAVEEGEEEAKSGVVEPCEGEAKPGIAEPEEGEVEADIAEPGEE